VEISLTHFIMNNCNPYIGNSTFIFLLGKGCGNEQHKIYCPNSLMLSEVLMKEYSLPRYTTKKIFEGRKKIKLLLHKKFLREEKKIKLLLHR
jgi:hypothetical protein